MSVRLRNIERIPSHKNTQSQVSIEFSYRYIPIARTTPYYFIYIYFLIKIMSFFKWFIVLKAAFPPIINIAERVMGLLITCVCVCSGRYRTFMLVLPLTIPTNIAHKSVGIFIYHPMLRLH